MRASFSIQPSWATAQQLVTVSLFISGVTEQDEHAE